MKFSKYFFSPQPNTQAINKYTVNFFSALSKKVYVINNNRKPGSRSVDIFRFTYSSDIMILNWPEDIIHLRFGLLQMLLSFISLVFFKAKGGEIVWICHNKRSHTNRFRTFSNLSRIFYTKISDFIIVHSEDALNYFQKERHKVHFLNHPTYEQLYAVPKKDDIDDIDVLIWGKITPYKGLSQFIENYSRKGARFNVTIIGTGKDEYHSQLISLSNGLNISIKNQFFSDAELNQYFKKSRIILLPYLPTDTFSSGALIHSLNSRKIIIGPAIGNFLDLQRWNAVMTYRDYSDLFDTIVNLLGDQDYYDMQLESLRKGIKAYYASNSWDVFIDNLLLILGKKIEKEFRPYNSETPQLVESNS